MAHKKRKTVPLLGSLNQFQQAQQHYDEEASQMHQYQENNEQNDMGAPDDDAEITDE